MGQIACSADGGCANCAAELIKSLQKKFPDQAEVFESTFVEEFDQDV